MKFSIVVNMDRFDPSQDMREVAKQRLELVRIADQGGFDVAWTAEHHTIEVTIARADPVPWNRTNRRCAAARCPWLFCGTTDAPSLRGSTSTGTASLGHRRRRSHPHRNICSQWVGRRCSRSPTDERRSTAAPLGPFGSTGKAP